VAKGYRLQPERHQRRAGDIAPRTALAITAVIFAGYALIGVTYVQSADPPPWKGVTAGVLIAALLGLQVAHSFPAAVPRLARYRPITLLAQAVITFAPFVFIGQGWLGIPGFLGASCLLILSPWVSLPCLAIITAASDTAWTILGNQVETTAYVTVATLMTSLVVFGMSRLGALVREAHAARSELAQLAVSQERLRFARDLQPLFGESIAEISSRCEQARLSLRQQPEEAIAELSEALLTARQTLTDVRSVASGYRETSLSAELASAQSVLAALDIDAEVTARFDPAPGAAEAALAMVLRDGLTELVRRDGARQCAITVTESDGVIRLQMVINAQVADCAEFLARLERQVGGTGGTVSTGRRGDEWFEFTAMMPRAGWTRQIQPLSRAILIASIRLRAPTLVTIFVR
jgi:two-component system, NarL family, sensor histidine kinase DesK